MIAARNAVSLLPSIGSIVRRLSSASAREPGQHQLTEANVTRGDLGAEVWRRDIDREQRAEQFGGRIDLIEDRVAEMQVAHAAEVAHLDRAAAVKAAVESRLSRHEAGQRFLIRRIEVRNLAHLDRREAEFLEGQLGARAQIDRQADAEAE